MSGWPCKPLGEVAEIEREMVAPEGIASGTPYIGLEHIVSGGELVNVGPVQNGDLKSTKYRFSADHVLYGKLRPYLAKTVTPDFAGVCSTEIMPIRPGPKLNRLFLAHFLRQPGQVELATARSAGANLPRLSPNELAMFAVPVPPTDEQRRIAAILDQADALRAKRRTALVRLDEMARAMFLELFGDPASNPKSFPLGVLSELGSLDRGVSKHRPRNAPELLGGSHPFIQTGDVSNCGGYLTGYKATYSDLGAKQSKCWSSGTLCITIAANIARVAILQFDAYFPDSVVGFQAFDPDSVEYVRVWFSFVQNHLEQIAPESTQKNINLAILRALPIPLPPVDARKKFALYMRQIRTLKKKLEQAHQVSTALFHSLQHRAFRGEL